MSNNKVSPLPAGGEADHELMDETSANASRTGPKKLAPLPKSTKHKKKKSSGGSPEKRRLSHGDVSSERLKVDVSHSEETPAAKPASRVDQLRPLKTDLPTPKSHKDSPSNMSANNDATVMHDRRASSGSSSRKHAYSVSGVVSPISSSDHPISLLSPTDADVRATPGLHLESTTPQQPTSQGTPVVPPIIIPSADAHASKPAKLEYIPDMSHDQPGLVNHRDFSLPLPLQPPVQPGSARSSVWNRASSNPNDNSPPIMPDGAQRQGPVPDLASLSAGNGSGNSLYPKPVMIPGSLAPVSNAQGVLSITPNPYGSSDIAGMQSAMYGTRLPPGLTISRNFSAGHLLADSRANPVATQARRDSTRRFSVPVTSDESMINELKEFAAKANGTANKVGPKSLPAQAKGNLVDLQRQGSGVLKKKVGDHGKVNSPNGGTSPRKNRRKSQQVKPPLNRRDSVVSRWAKAMWAASSNRILDDPSSLEEEMMDEDFEEDLSTPKSSDEKDDLQKQKERLMLMGVRSNSTFLLDFICTAYIFLVTDIYNAINPNPDYDYILQWVTTAVMGVLVVGLSASVGIQYRLRMHSTVQFHDILQALTILSIMPDVLWVVFGFNVYDFGADEMDIFWSRVMIVVVRAFKVFKWIPFLLRMQKDELENEELMMLGAKGADNFSGDVGVKIKQAVRQSTVEILCLLLALAILIAAVTEYFNGGHIGVGLGLMKQVYVLSTGPNTTEPILNSTVRAFTSSFRDNGAQVLYLDINGTSLFGSEGRVTQLRQFPPEAREYKFRADSSDPSDVACVLHLNERDGRIWAVAVDLVATIVLSYLILLMSGRLSKTLTQKVVRPIEEMVTLIEQFTKEPMKPIKRRFSHDGTQVQELKVVENGVRKFTTLVRLGFGEAGSRIIKNNMDKGVIQMRMPGRIIHGLFGSCDIRNLPELTEALQAEIAQVLNAITGHVHELVHRSGGAPTNRINDSFLLVWKPKRKMAASVVADSALRAFITAITDLSRPALNVAETPKVIMDSQKPLNMVKVFLEGRMPGYQLDVGCGLHYGWAVETAIGSRHKLEASYIGAQVNLTSTLQALTKQYGVSMLLDGETVRMLSHDLQGMCRFVDRIVVFGNKIVELFTYDMPKLRALGGTLDDHTSLKELDNGTFFALLAPTTSNEFTETFHYAVNLYLGDLQGRGADWRQAVEAFEACLKMEPNDGPSLAHLAFIGTHRTPLGLAPEHWRGMKLL